MGMLIGALHERLVIVLFRAMLINSTRRLYGIMGCCFEHEVGTVCRNWLSKA